MKMRTRLRRALFHDRELIFRQCSSSSQSKHKPLPYWFKCMTMTNEHGLPRLPVPRLGDTLARYFESVKPLASSMEEYEAHRTIVTQFELEEGRELQNLLLQRELRQSQSHSYPYSYIEKDWDDMYLCGRYESPINVNPAYELLDDQSCVGPREALARVAQFTASLLKWWNKVKKGKLEPDKKKQCMAAYARQLGTARLPQIGRDELVSYPQSRHIVVLREGHFYRMQVLSSDGKQALSKESIYKQLEKIARDSHKSFHIDISALTAQNRDLWAKHRTELIHHDINNEQTLSTIDSALFVLVLDNTTVSDMHERVKLSLHGSGKWRWFDKLQVIASLNGHLTINFEHSFSDGTIWNRWLSEVWHDMRGTDSGFAPLSDIPAFTPDNMEPEKLEWKLSNHLVDEVKQAEYTFANFCSGIKAQYFESSLITKDKCKLWKLSPDGVVQMAFQLAFYQLHHYIPATYESCSTRSFLHGRTETIRSATTQAAQFVKGVAEKASTASQHQLLKEAIDQHVKLAKLAQTGLGVDRHLLALNSLAVEHHIPSAFLRSPLRAASTNFQISSSNVSMPFLKYFVFGAVVPDGYGLGYLVQNNSVNVTITSYKASALTDADEFLQSLHQAFTTINHLANYNIKLDS